MTAADRSPINHPSDRRTDRVPAWLAGFLAWWQKWGLLITGLWLIGVSFAVLWVSLAFVNSQQDTKDKAQRGCVVAKQVGPWIIRDYERRKAMPPRVLAQYRALIPSRC